MAITLLQDLFTVREMKTKDLSFVIGTSINSISKYKESIFKGVDYEDARKEAELKVLYILSRYDIYSCFVVAAREDDEAVAYLVADAKENHVMLQYTKYFRRELGLQKHLLLPLCVDIDREVTVNWPTRKMFLFARKRKLKIEDRLTAKLIEEHRERLIMIDEYKFKEYEGLEYAQED